MGNSTGTCWMPLPHRMKFLPGRMHWTARGAFTGTCAGSLESLLPLRMKILPGRTALKMPGCDLPPFLRELSRMCNSTVEIFRMLEDMQGTAGFDL